MSNPCFLALALIITLFAQDEPTLKEQLKSAEDLVTRLEAENYAREPQLKAVEEEYARLQKQFEREIGLVSPQGARYLDEDKAKRGEKAMADYTSLRDAWRSFYGAQAAHDPVKGQLMKGWMVGDPRNRKEAAEKFLGRPPTDDELNDPEKLWDSYVANQQRREAVLRARITQLEKQSGYPPEFLEYVRLGALSKVTLDGVYFPYIQSKTPKELHEARANLIKLRQQAGK